MIQPIKDLAVDIFIKGLLSQLSRDVDIKEPKTLDEAYRIARKLETRIRAKIIPDLRGRDYRDKYESDNEYEKRNQEDNLPDT